MCEFWGISGEVGTKSSAKLFRTSVFVEFCRGEMPMEQDGNMQITIFFLWNFFNLYGILLITVYVHEGRDSWVTRKKTTTGLPTWARVQICEDQFCMDGWTWFRTCTEHCKTLGPSESALSTLPPDCRPVPVNKPCKAFMHPHDESGWCQKP